MHSFFQKILFFTAFFVSAIAVCTPIHHALAAGEFITTWDTTKPGTSGVNRITIPVRTPTFSYNYAVDWGDASTSAGVTGNVSHTYAAPGVYTVKITGTFPAIYFNNGGDVQRLVTVSQWGTNPWQSMASAFYGASNLDITATDTPVLTGVIDMSRMFYGDTSVTATASMNSWNVASVTNMSDMFHDATSFNQNISSWNTASATTMSGAFMNASSFNQNIGSWNVGRVANMSNMFSDATAFNQNISSWNTASATTMSGMFSGATSFNQNIGSWNTAAVTDMSGMFNSASAFNQNIGSWNTAAVTDMSGMFSDAVSFNQNIGSWNVANVTNMTSMFENNTSFNQNIGSWNVANVTDMGYLFYGATSFNQNLSSWNTGKVAHMNRMFYGASVFNQNISSWNTASVTTMSNMFETATSFNQNIGSWNVANVTTMISMFDSDTLSTANYDAILAGWSAQTLKNNVTFSGGNSTYCSSAAQRATIATTYSWTITDGGLACLTLTTNTTSSLGQTTATLNGTITNAGPSAISARGFEYGLTTSYGNTTTENGSFSTGAFSATVTGLTCGTSYHVRAYATNASGTSTGTDTTFSTIACSSPHSSSGGGGGGSGKRKVIAPTTTVIPANETPAQKLSRLQAQLAQLIAILNALKSGTPLPQMPVSVSVRDLSWGMSGSDVSALQKILVAEHMGPKALELSRYRNSTFFGMRTRDALIEYQRVMGILPADGAFTATTRSFMKGRGFVGVWW